MSGTPFRALNSGEFIEDQIINWTYSDEQRAKENWIGSGNPYLSLPRMVMLTYRIPDSIRQIAMQGEFDEFDLNIFFSAKGKGAEARIMSFWQPRDVLTVYRIAGTVTSSLRQVKLLALKARFTGGDERGYALVLAARPVGQMSGRDQIARLVRDAGGVDALLTRLTTAQ